MLRECTQNGLDAAKNQDRGRWSPPKLKNHQQEEIVKLVQLWAGATWLMSILLPYRVFSSATKFLNRVLRSIPPKPQQQAQAQTATAR
jgi:hypothetical protein